MCGCMLLAPAALVAACNAAVHACTCMHQLCTCARAEPSQSTLSGLLWALELSLRRARSRACGGLCARAPAAAFGRACVVLVPKEDVLAGDGHEHDGVAWYGMACGCNATVSVKFTECTVRLSRVQTVASMLTLC